MAGRLPAAPPPPPAGYQWVPDPRFTDEFNVTALDTNKWHDHHPRWKGRPPAKFVPAALAVTNGCLRIRADLLPEPDGPFTLAGGAVISRSEEAFYGYYEARMKASKISMSSTFWMSNRSQREGDASISQEIDINETVGAPRPEPAYREIGIDLKQQLRQTRQDLNETDENHPEIQRVIEMHWND